MNSVTLTFAANGQQLVRTGCEKFAANTVNYIQAKFDLGEGWDGFDSVRAVWQTDFVKIATVLDNDGNCTVPQEVLKRVNSIMVNLVGSISDGTELTDRLTTYKVKALYVNGATNIDGTETTDVTPSQFEQFVAIVKEDVGKVKDIDRVELNPDYTLTIYFSDGTSTTTGSIRGEAGPAGPEGPAGETGNGIESIDLTGSSGNVDTYTISFTNGSTTTFTVTNGEVTMEQLSQILPTDTASGSIASFPDGQSLFPMKSLKVNLDPIQDLHGYDKPWVGGGGANLLNSDYATKFTLSKTITFPQTILSGTKVYIHSDGFNYTTPPSSGNKYPYYVFRGANNENCGQVWGLQDSSVTLSGDAVAIELWSNGYDYGASSEVEVTINGLTISLTEQTQWTPYSNICPISGRTEVVTHRTGKNLADQSIFGEFEGDTYTTDLGQTVYGGTLDVVSGELVVDRAMVDLGSLNWGYSSADARFYNNSVDYKHPSSAMEVANAICSQYAITKLETLNDGTMCLYMNGYIYVKDSRYTDPTAFKQAMNGVQLVYELANPQTIQLTAQEVQTLLGQNNVWSEQGSVSVVYKADIQRWVEKKLA